MKKKKNRITLQKSYILSVFELVTYKKGEIGCKALAIGKQKDITRNVYNECLIIFEQKNLYFTRTTRQKAQKLVYIKKFLRYQNAETHE